MLRFAVSNENQMSHATKWDTLRAHAARLSGVPLSDLVNDALVNAPDAETNFSRLLQIGDLRLDLTRHRIDADAWSSLFDLARDVGISAARDALFAGEAVNETEGRAAFHMALRAPAGSEMTLATGEDVMADVLSVRVRMAAFADGVRGGGIVGATGQRFTRVINIGIGGSDLGPAMAVRALAAFHDGPRVDFVSNVDPTHLNDVLADADPATTLFLVASKTFTTAETLANARAARDWVVAPLGDDAVPAHFVALSAAPDAVREFGIADERRFEFWDWVGGRYSLWSAIGLSLMLAIGSEDFEAFLGGAHAVDTHVRTAEPEANAAVQLALLTVWYRNVIGTGSRVVLPYDQRLELWPSFLQQLDMESTGKRVRLDGTPIGRPTTPVIWGATGTNGQHAFFQWLHQGAEIVPAEFLVPALPDVGSDARTTSQHAMLVANALAQVESLMSGRNLQATMATLRSTGLADEEARRLAPHMTFPGGRPSTVILYPRLTPGVLGQLIALNEHRVFMEAVLWGVNAFDQYGVELGKVLAKPLTHDVAQVLAGEAPDADADRSPGTTSLLSQLAHLVASDDGH